MDKNILKKSYIEIAKSNVSTLFKEYETESLGLSEKEAKKRLSFFGYNQPEKPKKHNLIIKFFLKFLNPLILILLIIAIISYFFENVISSVMVSIMILVSVILDFIQEVKSGKEAEKLIELVKSTATVYRNKEKKEIPIKELVPGDIVFLSSGDIIPADIRLITTKDFFINRAVLTGESFPVEKISDSIDPKNDTIEELKNIAFMGTSVDSGSATGIVIKTGSYTKFGELSKQISEAGEYESSFEKGIKSYMWLMIKFTIILVLVIFLINALIKRHILEALLFSLAVAVGLTPEMLPMLVTVNLSKGAISMSKKQVIVKRLNAIQNLGAMDILCTDKTGTITLGEVILEKHIDIEGKENEDVLKLAYINSYYQTSLRNLLDKAILKHQVLHVQNYEKVDEIPFDFSRRIMSVIIDMENNHKLISKGAPESILPKCTKYELNGKIKKIDKKIKEKIVNQNLELSKQGFRVLAIAYKNFEKTQKSYSKEDEDDLILLGFTAFLDPPKPTAKKTIKDLQELGIRIIVLTGDNELVSKKICSDVGINTELILTGEQIDGLSDDDLKNLAKNVNVYARLNPIQKQRIIKLLKQDHVVGYLGDGINDAPSLKAADVGISVNNAADIAKESADIILLKKSLRVLADGVKEGRKTFGNIIKYIKMGSSSNFGNMFSLTGASLFLPFLPMAPLQILLNNFLYDLSQVAIPTDNVDEEYLKKSRPWDINGIKRFMLVFGPISSVFDFITFGVLLFIFQAPEEIFHTGWFWESIITQTLVIHVIRTEKIPFIESKPSKFLILTSLIIICSALIIPFSPLDKYFGFVIPPPTYFIALFLIVSSYLIIVQFVKKWFVKKYGYM
ncbi:MAG: magnesium-translocating P-type ATPase [Candidatus Woesearchaeota archaeon]